MLTNRVAGIWCSGGTKLGLSEGNLLHRNDTKYIRVATTKLWGVTTCPIDGDFSQTKGDQLTLCRLLSA